MHAMWKEWSKDRALDLWAGAPVIQYAEYEWLKGSQHYGPSDKGIAPSKAKRKTKKKK